MKILLLLRHAKSSWKDETLPDRERPLAKRGLQDAPRMGRLLLAENLMPDLIISSTARRARQTVEMVAEAAGYAGEIRWLDELYAAPPEEYLSALATLPESYLCVMMVGHNPGLEELVALLTEEEESLTTAALAQVDLSVAAWSEVGMETEGNLVNIWRPKEL
jgi:phosphohistidine phosphatase